jgi:nucleotide-binding universal stress UspA family protein
MFSKILVAFDGSKPSLEAVERAMEIGNEYNSSLIILHILDGYKYPYLLSSVVLAPTYGSDKLEKERQKFEELMNSLKEKYIAGKSKMTGTENDKMISKKTDTITTATTATTATTNTSNAEPISTELVDSRFETAIIEAETSAASTIVDYAESKNVDLLIIGSKGRTGLKKMLVGSTASAVVKYAHCPVLVVR